MANWTNEPQPFGQNRAPLLAGWASDNSGVAVPVAVNPSTGAILTQGGSSASSVAINDGVTTSRKASVLGLTDSNPLTVAITDGNGDQITSFGGGTQYTDAGTPPTHPVGPTLEFNNAGTWATVGSAHPLPVSGTVTATPTVASAIVNNQQTATTSAVALPSNSLTQGITVEALSTNTVSVFVGGSGVTTSTGLELAPGSAITLPINNSNLVFIRCASSSPVITFIGV